MKAIIDSCIISSVFNSECKNHCEFEPILSCINHRKIIIQFGGTKYLNELKKLTKYLKIITELVKEGVAVKLSTQSVDIIESEILEKNNDPDFDDPHLIAIQIVSKSKIICTNDHRAAKYLKMKELYPKNHVRPKLYFSRRNVNLLPS